MAIQVSTSSTGAPSRPVRAAQPVPAGAPRPIALLLPGQGAQHARMAAGLYGREPVFTAAVDAVLTLCGDDAAGIRDDWLATDPPIEIDEVDRAQPLLFAVDYALARLVESWGIRPAVLLGHSAGEVVAAVLAGVIGLADAVSVQRERIRQAARAPRGGMLAVAASPDELTPYLHSGVCVGVVNAPRRVLLSGPDAPLDAVAQRLRADGYGCRRLGATYPFHSPAMAPAVTGSVRLYAGLSLHPPTIPIYSCYTGALMTAAQATDPAYWATQPAAPVRFADALDALLGSGEFVLLETGPGQGLTSLAAAHRAVRGRRGDGRRRSEPLALLPGHPGPPAADRTSVLRAADRLRTEGYGLDPAALDHLRG